MSKQQSNYKLFTEFKAGPDNSIDLNQFDCRQDGGFSDSELKKMRNDVWQKLAEYQERLYAESEQSLLIVLQAMDAAGKDSTIDKLTSQLNAQGCHIHSFKKPSKLELSHDFLWRVHDKAPAKGHMTIFNRSHYEDVLIVKVHNWMDDETIQKRYQHINNFESLLLDNKTQVIKFMLHISPEYQLSRFKNRLEKQHKNWKFNPADLAERALWDDYMHAFSSAIENCSTEQAPWYIVPAENRYFRDYMLGAVLLEKLSVMNPQYPKPDYDVTQFSPNNLK